MIAPITTDKVFKVFLDCQFIYFLQSEPNNKAQIYYRHFAAAL